jgi:adenosylcobinamide-GDP ribazoletransferase
MATSLIWRLDYARAEGKAKPLAQKMSTGEFLIAAVTAVLPALAIVALHWLTWAALVAGVAFAALATVWLARKFVRRIGGYTGDCLGAVQQVSEVMFYLCALAALPA